MMAHCFIYGDSPFKYIRESSERKCSKRQGPNNNTVEKRFHTQHQHSLDAQLKFKVVVCLYSQNDELNILRILVFDTIAEK